MRAPRFAFALVVPALALFSLTVISPLVRAIGNSFYDYHLTSMHERAWNGLGHYAALLGSPDFYNALRNTLTFVVASVSIELVLGMGIALLLNQNVRFRNVLRGLVFVPWTIPTIVVALVWMWLYQPQYGIVNYVLQSVGIIKQPIHWLANLRWAMPAVIAAAVWKQTPLMVVMLLAGLQTVPRELVEAARVDGAGSLRVFWHITLPYLTGIITTTTLILVINNFQQFGLFWTMTGGGPINRTTTLAILTYQTAFEKYDLGLGSAIGVVWLCVLLAFAAVYTRLLRRSQVYS